MTAITKAKFGQEGSDGNSSVHYDVYCWSIA